MYSILITVMFMSHGGYPVAISTTSLGSYNNVATCNDIAKKMNLVGVISGNSLVRTAQCVQVKDKL